MLHQAHAGPQYPRKASSEKGTACAQATGRATFPDLEAQLSHGWALGKALRLWLLVPPCCALTMRNTAQAVSPSKAAGPRI